MLMQVRLTNAFDMPKEIVSKFAKYLLVEHTDAKQQHIHLFGDCQMSMNTLRKIFRVDLGIEKGRYTISEKSELFYQYMLKPTARVISYNHINEEDINVLKIKNIEYYNEKIKKVKNEKNTYSNDILKKVNLKLNEEEYITMKIIIKNTYSVIYSEVRSFKMLFPPRSLIQKLIKTLYVTRMSDDDIKREQESDEIQCFNDWSERKF